MIKTLARCWLRAVVAFGGMAYTAPPAHTPTTRRVSRSRLALVTTPATRRARQTTCQRAACRLLAPASGLASGQPSTAVTAPPVAPKVRGRARTKLNMHRPAVTTRKSGHAMCEMKAAAAVVAERLAWY